jgi:FKBP-type peptidyl-prolyl cis-trans isomerase (trigger factor)
MPKVGRRRKKTRTHAVEDETVASALTSSQDLKVPKSLVVGHFSEIFEHFSIHFMVY